MGRRQEWTSLSITKPDRAKLKKIAEANNRSSKGQVKEWIDSAWAAMEQT